MRTRISAATILTLRERMFRTMRVSNMCVLLVAYACCFERPDVARLASRNDPGAHIPSPSRDGSEFGSGSGLGRKPMDVRPLSRWAGEGPLSLDTHTATEVLPRSDRGQRPAV